MQRMKYGGWGWPYLLFILAACSTGQKPTDKLFNFDGLIDDQVSQLSQRKRVLEKAAELGGEKSDSTFLPTAKGWGDELEIFRQLDGMNKPASRNIYRVEDPVKDTRSNLRIRQYLSDHSPIRMVRFYYQNDFSRLRKIEAQMSEENLLFANFKTLTMEFEEEDSKPILYRYAVSGFQKIPLSDTLRFTVTGQINW